MKKKMLLWTALAVGTALLMLVAVWGQYYTDRYVGADYYAMVPLDYDMTSTPVKTMDGKEIGTAIEYRLTAYNEQGEAKSVVFRVEDPDSNIGRGEVQPQPGIYLWISASKQLVVRWRVIEESEVPAGVLRLLPYWSGASNNRKKRGITNVAKSSVLCRGEQQKIFHAPIYKPIKMRYTIDSFVKGGDSYGHPAKPTRYR